MDSPTCTFCSAAAVLVPTEDCGVCWTCARRIARLAAGGSGSGVWSAPLGGRDDEMLEVADRVAQQLAPGETDLHYELAVAYREMGLHADALREAAVALESTEDASRATAALRLLLTAPLLEVRGLHSLRERLVRMAKN